MGSEHGLLMMFPMASYCHIAGWSVENIDWSFDPLLLPELFPRPYETTAEDIIKGKGDVMDVNVKSRKDGAHIGGFFFLEFIHYITLNDANYCSQSYTHLL
jgi:hypothetical protein